MNILFVFPEIDQVGPRSIRIKNISSHLQLKNINVFIAKSAKNSKISKNEFLLPDSWVFSFIRYKIIKYLFTKILFPDIYILNYRSIKEYLIKMVNDHNINTVIFVKPFSLYFISKDLKKYFPNIRIVYDIGDPLYYNSAYLIKNSFKYLVEKKVLKYTDNIIVTNMNTKRYYQSIYKFPFDKIKIIPQGVNLHLVAINNNIKVKTQTNNWNFFYAGLFYKNLRNPYPFFNAIESFQTKEFHLSCYGVNKEFVSDKYANISFFPRKKQNELKQVIHKADVLLFIDNSGGIQTPGKIYELLAFKKIIFCIYENDMSETIKFLKSFDNVIFAKNNVLSIKKGLETLKYFYPKSDYNIEQFSWSQRAVDYKKVL